MKIERIKELLNNYNRINMKLEYNNMMGTNPENMKSIKDDFKILNTILEYVEEESKNLLEMIYKSKMSIHKVGRTLGYSESTIRRKMRKAINEIVELTE